MYVTCNCVVPGCICTNLLSNHRMDGCIIDGRSSHKVQY